MSTFDRMYCTPNPGWTTPKPTPVVPVVQLDALKEVPVQVLPRLLFGGTRTCTSAPGEINAAVSKTTPYETFSTWCANAGENSLAISPPGATSARYSPDAESRKFVCNSVPVERFFPDAKIVINWFASIVTLGNCHSERLLVVSVKDQPERSTAFAVGL